MKKKFWANFWMVLFLIACVGRFGYRAWLKSPQHQEQLREEEASEMEKFEKEHPEPEFKSPYKGDQTKAWRKDSGYIKTIKVAEMQNGKYTGGTTIGEVVAKMGKPTMVQGYNKDYHLQVVIWADKEHLDFTDNVKLYIPKVENAETTKNVDNIDNIANSQIVKVENKLEDPEE